MRSRLVLAALTLFAFPLASIAQGADAGRNLAGSCSACHNITGHAVTGMPAIAGRSREDLLRTLKDFKEGKRPATVMHQLAKGYTDGQLELIAAYFAAQK